MASLSHGIYVAQYLFYDTKISSSQDSLYHTRHATIYCMTTKLLKQAMERLSQLPPAAQDSAARAVMSQLEEEPEPGDRKAIAAGREDFARGNFSTLKEWRHEVGLGDH